MIYKFKFWLQEVGCYTEEVFEYDSDEYESYDNMIFQMEQDRIEWVFDNIKSGYTEIKLKEDGKI